MLRKRLFSSRVIHGKIGNSAKFIWGTDAHESNVLLRTSQTSEDPEGLVYRRQEMEAKHDEP